MVTTTDYGNWNNHGDHSSTNVETTVGEYIAGDTEWTERIHATGAFTRVVADYREAINDALPEGVSLQGNDFCGPYYEKDHTWEGELNIAAIIEGIDLGAIVEKHAP